MSHEKQFTAVDMANAATDGYRDGLEQARKEAESQKVCPICAQRAAVQAHIDAAEG